MSAAAPASFWAIAIAGSLALHGAIGMGLYAMPMPEPKQPTHTEITISAPEIDAQVQRAEPETIAARASEEAPVVAQPAGPALAANDATELAAQHQPAAVQAQTAPNSTDVEQARLAEVVATNNATETVAAAKNAHIAASQMDTDQVLAKAAPEAVPMHASDAVVAPSSDAVPCLPCLPCLRSPTLPSRLAIFRPRLQSPISPANTSPVAITPPAYSSPVAINPAAKMTPAIVGAAKPSRRSRENRHSACAGQTHRGRARHRRQQRSGHYDRTASRQRLRSHCQLDPPRSHGDKACRNR